MSDTPVPMPHVTKNISTSALAAMIAGASEEERHRIVDEFLSNMQDVSIFGDGRDNYDKDSDDDHPNDDTMLEETLGQSDSVISENSTAVSSYDPYDNFSDEDGAEEIAPKKKKNKKKKKKNKPSVTDMVTLLEIQPTAVPMDAKSLSSSSSSSLSSAAAAPVPQRQYDRSDSVSCRFMQAVQHFRDSFKFSDASSAVFSTFLSLGGYNKMQVHRQKNNGDLAEFEQSQEGQGNAIEVDFTYIVSVFLSYFITHRGWSNAEFNIAPKVIEIFLVFLLSHSVFPEFVKDIGQAVEVAKMAGTQLECAKKINMTQRDDFTTACCILFTNEYADASFRDSEEEQESELQLPWMFELESSKTQQLKQIRIEKALCIYNIVLRIHGGCEMESKPEQSVKGFDFWARIHTVHSPKPFSAMTRVTLLQREEYYFASAGQGEQEVTETSTTTKVGHGLMFDVLFPTALVEAGMMVGMVVIGQAFPLPQDLHFVVFATFYPTFFTSMELILEGDDNVKGNGSDDDIDGA